MYHYVYRITKIVEKKHYYGVRSCKCHPKSDLGIKYFSSSTDSSFINEQKENPDMFKYKVIKIFTSRSSAYDYEVKLHRKFKVGRSDNFYNRCSATTSKFSIAGNKEAALKVSKARKGTMPVKCSKTGEMIGSVSVKHPKVISGEWVHHSKGRKQTEEEKKRRASPGELNGRYSGITDNYIIELSLEFVSIFKCIPTWSKFIQFCDIKEVYMLKSLSKFRFGDGEVHGKRGYFKKMEELTNLKFSQYNDLRYKTITKELINEYKKVNE